MAVTDGFVDALLASPVGVTLLARLETRAVRPEGRHLILDSTPDSVAAAVEAFERMSFAELVEIAVLAGVLDVGPWIPDAADTAAAGYRHAHARAPIAEALDDHFATALHEPIARQGQQWWTTENVPVDRLAPLFWDYEQVYGAGQFSWAGLWTVPDPPDVAHEQLVDAWELYPGAISRWRLPVLPEARVLEVHRPSDWARLVMEHPRQAASDQESWELPGRNQRRSELSALTAVPNQRATRTTMRRHLVPDWRSVAERYDGVHLSWAGFITAEGCITDLSEGDVTMLRYWFSERTHWLADVFGEPEPAPAPFLPAHLTQDGDDRSVDVRFDAERQRRDALALGRMLGR
ncbi:MAG TPA: hypothetical protein VGR26_02080 [Acidimicrobiales bacterium]|nr:hypothetical protein [Acidimicrobiales bacterium]